MLWPTQLRICQLRRANIGASTDFIRVSPVLPSLPPVTVLRFSASSSRAGGDAPSDGVKLMYGQAEVEGGPGIERAGRQHGLRRVPAAGVSAASVWWTSPSSKGGSVEATLMTTTWSS